MMTIFVPLWILGTLSCINKVDVFTKDKLKNNLQIHYDKLSENCLNRTKDKVKIKMNYKSNVTKITTYNIEKDFGEIINLFLQEGQIYSEKKKKTISIIQGYNEKLLYLKFLFTIVVISTL